MIKVNMNNIEYIKQEHRKYIKDNVERRLNLYSIFNNSNNKVANFIVNVLYKDLYHITLEELNFEYIKKIDKEYQNIKEKKIIDYVNEQEIKKALNKIKAYLDGLNEKNGINEKENLKKVFKDIKISTLEKIDLSNLNNINFERKDEIIDNMNMIINFLETEIKNKNQEYYTLNQIINDIFDYQKFSNREIGSWGRRKLIYSMNVGSCPYCNINDIKSYFKDDYEKITADLDHFLCKKEYPYLAVSIYNFIPSCSICNSRLKGSKNFLDEYQMYVFPLKEEFGKDAVFRTCFNENSDLDFILGNNLNFDINIEVKTKDDKKRKRIENSIKTFDLNERYSNYKEVVRDIIKKMYIYNDYEINQILRAFDLFEDNKNAREKEAEIKKLIFGFDFNRNNLSDKSLSKLILDIFEEFNLKY